jgi:hypothetical protein
LDELLQQTERRITTFDRFNFLDWKSYVAWAPAILTIPLTTAIYLLKNRVNTLSLLIAARTSGALAYRLQGKFVATTATASTVTVEQPTLNDVLTKLAQDERLFDEAILVAMTSFIIVILILLACTAKRATARTSHIY